MRDAIGKGGAGNVVLMSLKFTLQKKGNVVKDLNDLACVCKSENKARDEQGP